MADVYCMNIVEPLSAVEMSTGSAT